MEGNAFVFTVDLHLPCTIINIYFLPNVLVRDTIIVFIYTEPDMTVVVNGGSLVGLRFPRVNREGT